MIFQIWPWGRDNLKSFSCILLKFVMYLTNKQPKKLKWPIYCDFCILCVRNSFKAFNNVSGLLSSALLLFLPLSLIPLCRLFLNFINVLYMPREFFCENNLTSPDKFSCPTLPSKPINWFVLFHKALDLFLPRLVFGVSQITGSVRNWGRGGWRGYNFFC